MQPSSPGVVKRRVGEIDLEVNDWILAGLEGNDWMVAKLISVSFYVLRTGN